jgi:hypothetical protein
MKPAIELLIGATVRSGEALFLRHLVNDLQPIGNALVLVNFEVPNAKSSTQIDFLVVTSNRTELIELKNLNGPIVGTENGPWILTDYSGKVLPYGRTNPWQQARDAKLALNDALRRYAKTAPGTPSPIKGSFYDFDASVCIYPSIDPRSKLIKGSFKAWVRSYPELIHALVNEPKASNWKIQDWKRFAIEFLKLHPSSLSAASDAQMALVEQSLGTYVDRVREAVGQGLPPLLVPHEDQLCGDPVITKLSTPENHLLVGPSGLGKSFHVSHFVLRCLGTNEIPIEIRAVHYKGDIGEAINKSLGSRTTVPFETLAAFIETAGRTPVLVLDNLNECAPELLGDLLNDLLSIELKFGARLVISSQFEPPAIAGLTFQRTELASLRPEQRRAIYCFHAGVPSTADVDHLCTPFSNAYDLKVAGKCHESSSTSSQAPPTRFELYRSYSRNAIPRRQHSSTLALLRKCAATMDSEISYWLPRDRFESALESHATQSGIPIALIDELQRSRLMKIDDDTVRFEHDLLRDYFLAEHLLRTHASSESLSSTLKRPKYQKVIDLVVTAQTTKAAVRTIMESITTDQIFRRCMGKQCGRLVESVIKEDWESLFSEAQADLPNVKIIFHQDEDGAYLQDWPTLSGFRTPSNYQAILADAVAENLDNQELRDKFLDLLDLTEWALRGVINSTAKTFGLKPKQAWAGLIHSLGIQPSTTTLPTFRIISGIKSRFHFDGTRQLNPEFRDELMRRIESGKDADLALLILLESAVYDRTISPDDCIRLLVRGWDSGLSTIRMAALHMVHFHAYRFRGASPEKAKQIADIVGKMSSKNIFLSSTILDTMNMLGALEVLVTPEAALTEMREVLQSAASGAETNELCQSALGILSNIFEDIFQGAYSDAYTALDPTERVRLLILASRAESTPSNICWILQELIRLDASDALPDFERFAVGVVSDTSFPQESVGAFVLGICGSARFGGPPPRQETACSPDELAWGEIAQVLYRRFQSEAGAAEPNPDSCWETVRSQAPLAVADVLYQLSHGHYLFEDELKSIDLLSEFPRQVRQLLEFSLENRSQLTSIFMWGGAKDSRLIRFVISSLGRLGAASSLGPLKAVGEDPEFGADAIAAIDKINSGLLRERGDAQQSN